MNIQSALKIVTDRHIIGIFGLAVWHRLFKESGFRIEEIRLDHLYDAHLLGEGEYRMTGFLGHKLK